MAGATKVEFDVLANDKASAKLDKIANTFLNMGRAASKVGDVGGKSMGKLTQGAGFALKGLTKLPALAAGTAVGALFISGLASAMEVQDANAKLQASLGLNKAESAKAGKIAGDLYKNAYGESVGEVSGILSTVFQSGLASVKSSETAIKGVTTQVMNFSKISNEEALPVTRAVSQMLKTGLAKNATEAFDILTRGQQLGINKSEDLLDTFNEYGTQFRKLGLDGPKALGLMNQALQAGARDSDVAADALKEFSIRAVDGSKTTIDGFKSLKLNAKDMQEQISQGGPKAAAGLDTVLDRLRAVKDPAERSRIAVELFGTQAEDLGAALFAFDPSKAVAGLGKLKGAAQDAGDALNDTASNKLQTVVRTIKMSLVDALGKYALPKLEEFADWFNGPGKFVLVSWALEGGSAILGLADKMLGALSGMIGGLSKYGKVAMIAAAGSVAAFNPGMALDMLKNADALGKWADEAKTGIGNARTELQGWKGTLDKTNTKVKFQANIADLESKIAKAQKELKDPNITKERTAKLNADIRALQAKLDAARGPRGLADPKLIATKTAKLEADKRSLDAKIATAKAALADPKLTATKRAKLDADIRALIAKRNQAQAAINALKGKTVTIRWDSVLTGSLPPVGGIPASIKARAKGGPVKKGSPYLVGEDGPEIVVPNSNGMVLSNSASKARGSSFTASGGGMTININVNGALDPNSVAKQIQQMLLRLKRNNGGELGIA